jgi:hypothetical protein
MLGSDTLTNIPSESRVDGWHNPFCISVGLKQVVFISSGGDGVQDCNQLQQTAGEAAAASHDARLTKAGNLLVTVQSRSGGATALGSLRIDCAEALELREALCEVWHYSPSHRD